MTPGELLLLIVATVAGAIVVVAHRASISRTALVALVATIITVGCLWLPARLQAAELVTSKLTRAGLLAAPSESEISTLASHWALELVVIVAVEWLFWHAVLRRRLLDEPLDVASAPPRRLAVLLVVMGAVATVVLPAPALEDRADGGNGVATLLRTFLLVGLALLAYHRAFGRPVLWLLLGVGVCVLVLGNVRSPLLVLVLAYAIGELHSGAFRRASRLAMVVTLVVAFALGGSFMSNMRANVTRDYGYSVGEVAQQTLENPWVAPFESGIDTLDGYRFSRLVAPWEPARPADLLGTVLTFVPRAVWPEKPDSISVDLSAKYLDYRSSGQFLSPVGYLTLALGSYPLALIGFGGFGLLIAALFRATRGTFAAVIVLVVLVRFLLGGSSFDLYYGLTLCVPLAVGGLLLRIHALVQGEGKASTALPRNAGLRAPF